MSLTTDHRLLLSLADIARVAQVQRPVVTMWRRRTGSARENFPQPVEGLPGPERFDARDVVDYLELTGRGNNPQAGADVAAFTELRAVCPLDPASLVDALTALLCLRVIIGEPLAGYSAGRLRTLASEVDPADRMLVREIAGLGDDLPALAQHTDALVDASYAPPAAFELVLRRERQVVAGFGVRLHDDAHRLVAGIARGLADDAGLDGPTYADPTDGGSDLLLAVRSAYGELPAPEVSCGGQTSRAARLARRRLRVHDIPLESEPIEDDAVVQYSGAVVIVGQFPSPGQPTMADPEILDAIDNIVLQMDDRQRAVLIGPASAIADRLPSAEADVVRDRILRLDRVRAAIRLPQGLIPQSSRQSLALWVLGPAHPHVSVERRWTVLGDLSNTHLSEPVIDDLISDVVASMGEEATVRAHAFRFAVRTPTAGLIVGRRPLIGPVPPTPSRPTDAARLAVRIDDLTTRLAPSTVSALRVDVRPDADVRTRTAITLGEAVVRGHCRVIPGNRMDPADLTAPSGAPVLGAAELTGDLPPGHRYVDRLSFAASNPAGRYTEPGDVVFTTSPAVRAMADEDGGSVVVSPARVIRINTGNPGGLVAHVLAADINSTDPAAKRWQLWRARQTPPDQRAALAMALLAIERTKADAHQRLADLGELATTVIDGITDNSLTIYQSPSATAQPSQEGQH